jgi:hypothetical protein
MSTTFGTKEGPVRAQIEAVKSFLRGEGLADVEDPLEIQRAFGGFHIIRATFNEKLHRLRVGFGWLADRTPAGVADWLREHPEVLDLLKDADIREAWITRWTGRRGGGVPVVSAGCRLALGRA